MIFSGAQDFLKSSCLRRAMAPEFTVLNHNNLVNYLYNAVDWCKRVFGYKMVKKYHVTGFFFQFLATDMLNFEVIGRNALRCFITETPGGKDKYLDPMLWEGMMFGNEAHDGAAVDFDNLVQHFHDTQRLVDQY